MTNVPSIFDRVLDAHEEVQLAEARTIRERADADTATRAAFVAAFREIATRIARPVFTRFVEDAKARGYTARIDNRLDDPLRPAIALYVNPRKGRLGEQAASEHCSFELAALVGAAEIEHISHFDLRSNERGHRINPDGTKKGAFGLASLELETIERELEEFWMLSLRSRKPE